MRIECEEKRSCPNLSNLPTTEIQKTKIKTLTPKTESFENFEDTETLMSQDETLQGSYMFGMLTDKSITFSTESTLRLFLCNHLLKI